MHTDSHSWFGKCLGLSALLLISAARAEVPTSQPAPAHRLRFSLVAAAGTDTASDSFADPSNAGRQLKVCKESILDETSLASVDPDEDQNGTDGVAIELTDSAGKTFHTFTSAHLHDRLAIVFDGKILSCATIMSPIGKRLRISLSDSNSRDAAGKIATAMRTAMVQASTQPTNPK